MYKNYGSDFFMDSFDRDTLRGLYESDRKNEASRRGSVFVTVLIIMIFVFCGIFYLKTAKPDIYNAALECIKSALPKGQEGAAPTGEMLRAASELTARNLSAFFLP